MKDRIVAIHYTFASYGRKKGDDAPPRQHCVRIVRDRPRTEKYKRNQGDKSKNTSAPIRLYDINGNPLLVSSPLIKKLEPETEAQRLECFQHPEWYESPEFAGLVKTAAMRIVDERGGEKDVLEKKHKNVLTLKQAFNKYAEWFALRRVGVNRQIKNSSKLFQYFGEDENIYNITNERAKGYADWLVTLKVKKTGTNLTRDTIRLYITLGSQLFTYLKKNNLWHGENPFFGVYNYCIEEFRNVMPPPEEDSMIRTLSDDEHAVLWNVLCRPEFKDAMVDWVVGCCTGLRDSERIYKDDATRKQRTLKVEDFDFKAQTLRYLRSKPTKLIRVIHVPKALLSFIKENCPAKGPLVFCGKDGVRLQLYKAAKIAGIPVSPKTPRKIFCNWFTDGELGDGSEWALAVHQGREAANVIEKSYLERNPIKVGRPVIERLEPLFEKTFKTESKLRLVSNK